MKTSFTINKISKNKMYTLLVSVLFCHYTLFDYFADVIKKIPIVSNVRVIFFSLIYLILTLLSFNKVRLKFVRLIDLSIILFFTFSILFTCILYPDNIPFIVDALRHYMLPCIPAFILGLCTNVDEEMIAIVSKFSCIAIIVNMLYLFYYLNSGRNLAGENYSMHWSYLLLPNTLFVIDYAFRNKKLIPIICSIVGIIYAVAMGTRGPIVVIFSFLIICLWRHINIKISRKVIIMMFFIIIFIFFIATSLYMQALHHIKEVLSQYGASTRNIDYLINGQLLSHTSGRDMIYKDLISRLSDRPLLGYGIYGEWTLGYYSAHNMYIELLYHYGYPMGLFLIISFVFVYVKAIKLSKGSISQSWIVLFGCLVFIKGIFGGRYMDYTLFFLLGLCLREIRYRSELDKM